MHRLVFSVIVTGAPKSSVCFSELSPVPAEDSACVNTLFARITEGIRSIRGLGDDGEAWTAFATWFDEALSRQNKYWLGSSSIYPRFTATASFGPARSGTPGLKTLRTVQPHEVVTGCPCIATMHIQSALQSGVAVALRTYIANMGHIQGQLFTAMHLTWEALHLEKSFFKPYIQLLPPVGSSVHAWRELFRVSVHNRATKTSTAEADAIQATLHLAGPYVVSSLREYESWRAHAVDVAKRHLLPHVENELIAVQTARLADALDEQARTELDKLISKVLSWALDIVRTRSWGQSCGINCLPRPHTEPDLLEFCTHIVDPQALIPLIDFTNHHSQLAAPTQAWTSADNSSVIGLGLVNGPEKRSAGEEIFNKYFDNRTCNVDILLRFSFVLDEPWRDCVNLNITLFNGSQQLIVLRDGNLIPEESLDELRRQAPSIVAPECDYAMSKLSGGPLSLSVEMHVLRHVQQAYSLSLARINQSLRAFHAYSISSGSPDGLQSTESASPNALLASTSKAGLTVAHGSRRILEAALEAIKQRWLSLLTVESG